MTELTNALERIFKWTQQHRPRYINYLQPGLSRDEIEDLVKDLPFQIPSELYELYQWRNGARDGDLGQETAWIFGNWTFKPLEQVVAQYKEAFVKYQQNKNYSKYQRKSYFNNFKYLNIFYDATFYHIGFVMISKILDFCPVIWQYFDEGELVIHKKFTNIVTMMQTIAECYETGTYYIHPTEDDGFFVHCHPQAEHYYWRKYNSQTIEIALQALQQGLFDGQFFIYFSQDFMEFKDSRALEPLLKELETPIDLSEDFFYYIDAKEEIIKILGELGDNKAVPAIISALEDEDFDNLLYTTKFHAAKSLGQLKDKRASAFILKILQDSESHLKAMAVWALGEVGDIKAIEPLSQLLKDEDNNVREAVKEALSKLKNIDAK